MREDGRRLFETCDSLRTAAEAGATASELAGKTRATAAEIRAALAEDGYPHCSDVSGDGNEPRDHACVDAARALASLLFAYPPRDAPKRGAGDDGSYPGTRPFEEARRSRLASRDDAWAAASAAVAAAWRVSIDDDGESPPGESPPDGSSSEDEASSPGESPPDLASAIAGAFLDPDSWLPRIAGVNAGSPFAQRRAECAAVATLTSVPSSAAWRRAVRTKFLALVDAASAAGSGVGCVGVALLLRAGAGVVEAFAGDAKARDGDVGVAEDAKAFGVSLMDRCDDAGERRTRRRVERALRGT